MGHKASQDDAFESLMLDEGVQPIKNDRISIREQLKKGDAALLAERRRAAEGDRERLSLEPETLVHPLDPLAWKRDGVQEGVYRNLRLGKYSVDARLDLINRPLTEAFDEVPGFVKQSYSYGLRTVMIAHGKPKTERSNANLIRSCLALWLPKIDLVLAFHSATAQQGGLSATYLLLRKNEQQKRDNQERFKR